ncbi:helix-turn-helix domain-containing protein [Kitasatospora sp. NPDC056138]
MRLAGGEETTAVARDLRISERSVERWRRASHQGGSGALRSAG